MKEKKSIKQKQEHLQVRKKMKVETKIEKETNKTSIKWYRKLRIKTNK